MFNNMKDVISKIFKSNYSKQIKARIESQQEEELLANKNEFGFAGFVKLKSLKVKFLQVKKQTTLTNTSREDLKAKNLSNQFIWTGDTSQLFWVSPECELYKLDFVKINQAANVS